MAPAVTVVLEIRIVIGVFTNAVVKLELLRFLKIAPPSVGGRCIVGARLVYGLITRWWHGAIILCMGGCGFQTWS